MVQWKGSCTFQEIAAGVAEEVYSADGEIKKVDRFEFAVEADYEWSLLAQ